MGEFDLVNLMRVCNGLVNQLQPQAVRRLRMLNSWGPIGRHKEGGLRMRTGDLLLVSTKKEDCACATAELLLVGTKKEDCSCATAELLLVSTKKEDCACAAAGVLLVGMRMCNSRASIDRKKKEVCACMTENLAAKLDCMCKQ